MASWVEAALAAECRAVEEGHHARWDDARQRFLVKSDNGPRTYEVTVNAVVPANLACPAWLTFGCTCPAGVRGGRTASRPVPCKHAALVARRLERMGLASWAGEAAPWRPEGALAVAARRGTMELAQ